MRGSFRIIRHYGNHQGKQSAFARLATECNAAVRYHVLCFVHNALSLSLPLFPFPSFRSRDIFPYYLHYGIHFSIQSTISQRKKFNQSENLFLRNLNLRTSYLSFLSLKTQYFFTGRAIIYELTLGNFIVEA